MSIIRPLNILIVKNRAMGDSIMGLSSLTYTKSLFPNANIYYAIPSWVKPIFDETENDALKIIGINLKTFKGYLKLNQDLKLLNLDIIFELFQSGRTSKFFYIFSKLNKAKYFFHNHHSYKSNEPNIQRDLFGLWQRFESSTQKKPNYINFEPNLKYLNQESSVKNLKNNSIIFGVVATRDTKMWAISHFCDLANNIINDYPDHKIIIPLSNSTRDIAIEKKLINQKIKATIVHLPLNKLPNLFSQASLYIGNDTGLKHLAVALKLRTITLFGPESPAEWHPYDQKKHPYFYIKNLECRTEHAHFCGLENCESMICLKKIEVKQVFTCLQQVLSS